jgi:type VI secretion system protein ImpA
MKIETLLEPVSEDCPCGPDLGYAPDFVSLEHAVQGKPERRIGETVIPAEEPDWILIKQRAQEFFSRTKDLRVAILLTRALTHCDGIVGFAAGLRLIEGLLTRYWEQVHPCLDTDEENDPTMRLNVLASLADTEGLVHDIRHKKVICANNHTRLAIRDILVTLGKLPVIDNEVVFSQAEIEDIIRAPENTESIQAMRDIQQVLENIQIFLSEKAGPECVPDIQPLYDMFKSVIPLSNVSPEPVAVLSGETDRPVAFDGEIRSREEAARLLEKICLFIERTEPANPASLLIRRAQSLMTKNFVEIIKDLAPGSLEQILRVTGLDQGKE